MAAAAVCPASVEKGGRGTPPVTGAIVLAGGPAATKKGGQGSPTLFQGQLPQKKYGQVLPPLVQRLPAAAYSPAATEEGWGKQSSPVTRIATAAGGPAVSEEGVRCHPLQLLGRCCIRWPCTWPNGWHRKGVHIRPLPCFCNHTCNTAQGGSVGAEWAKFG